MELTDLRIFLSIAEQGTISRAAEQLGYVQSNVTARLRKLEEELGTSLFRRLPKGVELTERGNAFREYAVQIVRLAEDAVDAVREPDMPGGNLRIGVVETVTCGNFMGILSAFQQQYPQVALSLVTGQSPELLEQVLDYRLDGAFLSGDPASAGLSVEYEQQDELKWLSQSEAGRTLELSGLTWAVSPRGCPYRAVLEKWLHSEGVEIRQLIEVSSLETLLSCVRSGLASTLLPASVLQGGYESLRAVSIPEGYRHAAVRLVRRECRFAPAAFRAFAEMVRARGL
ncbi:LysR family transcriptional regulator [Paenibacillus sp. 1P07SE]|uniref:LysR family transcriptional regulator n=1 Tax=Paenibacillus sp. 1P07SE TaxID=3132209 RepID=UPI0039A48D43